MPTITPEEYVEPMPAYSFGRPGTAYLSSGSRGGRGGGGAALKCRSRAAMPAKKSLAMPMS